MPNYEIHFDICALILYIMCLIVYFSKKDTKKLQNKVFMLVLLNGLTASIADIAASLLMAHGTPSLYLAADFCNYVYLAVHNALPATFCIYVIILTGSNKRMPPVVFTAFFMPFAVALLGILLNPITHAVFYYDAQHVYHHSWFMVYLYADCALYFCVVMFYILRFSVSFPGKKTLFLSLFVISAAGAVVFQFFFPTQLIELFVQAIACLAIIMTIENDEELFNAVTGVYNRRAFILENIAELEGRQTYSLIIIRLLNQKYYLSVLGYRFTQELNTQVAQYLVGIAGMTRVYDLDNGTFAILLDGEAKKRSSELTGRIYEKFSLDWIYKDISIAFETQICVVLVPRDINSLESLITLVDATDIKADNRVSIVQEEQLKYMQRHAAIENAIEKALRTNGFQVYYQPIWDCKANKIHSHRRKERHHHRHRPVRL